jgi:serine/threonine protein kinase/tetratricopeptide (TPR) repeat protein
MGEVYRAHDHRLRRDVAVKVLPELFASNPDRLARFQREARVLASLNHPNIASIYGLEENLGKQFLVMELVDGETLSGLIRRTGQVPVDEAIRICAQVAEGLEAAHLKGVTHRDIKPANIKINPEGRVKILDFGLAKAIWDPGPFPEVSDASTVTELKTELGHVVGTPPYMSPEQTRGQPVDQRTDVWSFGCLLFELLAGQRAFPGETNSDTRVAILEREPAWGALPSTTPAKVRELLRACLRKDINLRLQGMHDVVGEFRRIHAGRPSHTVRNVVLASAALILLIATPAALVPGVRRSFMDLIYRHADQQGKHLAVLPFLNIGNDPVNQVFCDGLVESLTSNLTQMERFHESLLVVPSSEVRRQSVSSPSDARRSFAVNLVVTGSVERTGDNVILRVNLVDTKTLLQLSARSIDIRREDLSKMEDQLLDVVAELLDFQLQPQARTVLTAGGTTIADAYDEYLLGRGYLRRYDKEGNLELAISAFKEALQRDSRYALAYTGLGEAYLRTFDRTKSPEWLELAKDANARAIDLNERLALAHVNQGMTLVASGGYDAAVKEFQRALDLDSLNPDAYRELGSAYEAMNRIQDAENTYKRAIQLRPNDWLSYSTLGVFYYRHGRYQDAEKPFRKVIELTPDNVNGYSNLGGLYIALAQYDQAETLLKKAIQVKPSDARSYSNLGTVYFQRGQFAKAVPMFEEAVNKGSASSSALAGNLADAYRWAPGFESKAPAAYRRAIELAEQQLAVNPRNAAVLSSESVYRAKLGQKDRALHDIALARQEAPTDKTIAFKAVVVLELAGHRTEALAAVGNLLKGGFARDQIEVEPELKALRQDPAFIRMVSRDAAGGNSPSQTK